MSTARDKITANDSTMPPFMTPGKRLDYPGSSPQFPAKRFDFPPGKCNTIRVELPCFNKDQTS